MDFKLIVGCHYYLFRTTIDIRRGKRFSKNYFCLMSERPVDVETLGDKM